MYSKKTFIQRLFWTTAQKRSRSDRTAEILTRTVRPLSETVVYLRVGVVQKGATIIIYVAFVAN